MMRLTDYRIKCIEGYWIIQNQKTGKIWKGHYKTAEKAHKALVAQLSYCDPVWQARMAEAKRIINGPFVEIDESDVEPLFYEDEEE